MSTVLVSKLEELADEMEKDIYEPISRTEYGKGAISQAKHDSARIRFLIASATEILQPSDEVIARTLERVEKQFSATHPEEPGGLREKLMKRAIRWGSQQRVTTSRELAEELFTLIREADVTFSAPREEPAGLREALGKSRCPFCHTPFIANKEAFEDLLAALGKDKEEG